MEYLVTFKQDGEVLKQSRLPEQMAFKLLQEIIEAVYRESTSSEIARLSVVAKLKDGKAQALEYNGRTMVFQVA